MSGQPDQTWFDRHENRNNALQESHTYINEGVSVMKETPSNVLPHEPERLSMNTRRTKSSIEWATRSRMVEHSGSVASCSSFPRISDITAKSKVLLSWKPNMLLHRSVVWKYLLTFCDLATWAVSMLSSIVIYAPFNYLYIHISQIELQFLVHKTIRNVWSLVFILCLYPRRARFRSIGRGNRFDNLILFLFFVFPPPFSVFARHGSPQRDEIWRLYLSPLSPLRVVGRIRLVWTWILSRHDIFP